MTLIGNVLPPYGVLCERCRRFTVDPEHPYLCDPVQKWSTVFVKDPLASKKGEVDQMFAVADELRVPQHPTAIMLPVWYVTLWPLVRVRDERQFYRTPESWSVRPLSLVKQLIQEAIVERGGAEP